MIMNDQLERVFREMCSRVGADYDSIDFREPGWFGKHSWTFEQERDFEGWLTKEFKKKKVSRALYGNALVNDKSVKLKVGMFLLNYGWKPKEEDNDETNRNDPNKGK